MRVGKIAATVAVGTMLATGTAASPAAAAGIAGTAAETAGTATDRTIVTEIPADPATVVADAAPGTVLVSPDAGRTARAGAATDAAGTLALACNGMVLIGSGTKASPEYWYPIHVFSDGSLWLDCWMGVGHHSWAVAALQMGLRECYGQQIPLDGIYGSLTVGAVKNVQRFHGWSVDGVYGTQTSRMAFPSTPKGRFFPHC